jgi:hypothetical protein
VKTSIAHVAMDTHKKQHQVAWVRPQTGEIQEFSVANTPREIERMVRKIRPQTPGEIHVCYEVACTEGHRERTYENTLKKTC